MDLTINKTTMARLFLIIVSALYVLFVCDQVIGNLQDFSGDEVVGGLTRTLMIIGAMIGVCILYFIIFSEQQIKTSVFFNFFLVWTIIVSINIWLNTPYLQNETNQTIGLIVKQALLHFFLFAFFYAAFKYYGDSLWKLFNYIIVGWYIIIAFTYSVNYSVFGALVLDGSTYLLGISYVLLYSLPLALCLKNKFLKWFCVVVGAIVVLSSIKRGGILAFTFAMLVYYFVHNIYIKKTNHPIRNILSIILSMIILVTAFVIYDEKANNGLIIERINNLSEDDGSGRGEVMSYMINYIPQLSLQELIIGHGFEGSREFSPLELTAHNDFLEALYDYGLIGLIVYLYFYIILFKKLRLLIKQKSEYAAPLAAGVALFCFLSMISHIIIYLHFAWYAIILGVFEGMTSEIDTEIDIKEELI